MKKGKPRPCAICEKNILCGLWCEDCAKDMSHKAQIKRMRLVN